MLLSGVIDQLPLGVWSKFVLLLAVASAVTMGVYHFCVRPFAVPRFLCGMKTRRRALRAALAPLAAAGILLVASLAR